MLFAKRLTELAETTQWASPDAMLRRRCSNTPLPANRLGAVTRHCRLGKGGGGNYAWYSAASNAVSRSATICHNNRQ